MRLRNFMNINKMVLSFVNETISNKTDKTVIQIFRYIIVGAIAFTFDFGTLLFLTEILNIYYLVSAAFAFIMGITINYVLSISWVFKYRTIEKKWIELGIFSLIGFTGLIYNELIMWFFTDYIDFSHYSVSKIISSGLVFFWNFFAKKYLLFRK